MPCDKCNNALAKSSKDNPFNNKNETFYPSLYDCEECGQIWQMLEEGTWAPVSDQDSESHLFRNFSDKHIDLE